MMRDGALQTENRGLEPLSAPDVVSVYRQSLHKRGFIPDAAQWRAVERLQRLYEEWTAYKARRNSALYPNGLQRERFVPAIGLLKERLDVLEVDGGVDYRRLKMEHLKVYHCPPGAEAERRLERTFAELADVEEEHHPLDVEGRRIGYRRRAGGIVWFDFQVLCGGPRSYADYVDLARRFHTVILSGVPRLSANNADAARRFTWLVDVFYDDRVKLVVSAEAQPEELYTEGTDSAEFARAASRLHEMQSADYLQAERARH